MMLVVRLYPKTDLESLWEVLENNTQLLEAPSMTPLYASQQEGLDHIAVVFEIMDVDAAVQFYTKNIASVNEIRRVQTLVFMLPTYFPVPKKHPEDLQRFLILLSIDPQHYGDVYNHLVETKLPENVFITYLCYSFGDDDMLISALSDSKENVKKFLGTEILGLEGIRKTSISPVIKSKRLTSKETWQEHVEKHLYKGLKMEDYDKDYDWEDYAALSGAFIKDIQ